MRKLLFCLLTLCCSSTFAQTGTTFKVEELSKPEELLPLVSYKDLYQKLILFDKDYPRDITETDVRKPPFNVIAMSEAPDSIISIGYNSFFRGMQAAYAEHRPFVLSPDMIWLLISQGFAQHINANSELMRDLIVDFSGKQSLIINEDKKLDDPTLSWEKVFSQFSDQISKNVSNELVETLTCNFSTTTPLEKIASEITIMEATKSYFEFIMARIVCGIPEITLEGTTEDWEKVLNKARRLKQYQLDWWITELEPILEEFVKASKGEVDQEFWRNMFKRHLPKRCGDPTIVDGWIVKFFPYNKEGKRNDLKTIVGDDRLPNEIVKVDVKYLEIYNDTIIETPLELWSGFIGLTQNKDNFTLRPQIGWMIKKKDDNSKELLDQLRTYAKTEGFMAGLSLRVKEFPTILLQLDEIKELELNFIDEIKIPDEISKIKIKRLRLFGLIEREEIQRIKRLLPNTDVVVNERRM